MSVILVIVMCMYLKEKQLNNVVDRVHIRMCPGGMVKMGKRCCVEKHVETFCLFPDDRLMIREYLVIEVRKKLYTIFGKGRL